MASSIGPMEMLQTYQSQGGSTRLHITAPIGLTQGYLTRLFSLIPGLEYCDLNETTGISLFVLQKYSVSKLLSKYQR